ncbi:hypothetical protein [Desertimonas flava]|uniref:hypothetical protein n=1 Tax=Desertimonas flava TaxID=2064846 RepID=UPI000E34AFC6|nr:hypothetical protein [Desertimonas flava]
MTDRTDRPIVARRPNGPPEKRNQPFAVSWFAPVVYVLDDGTEQPATVGPYSRKRDAVAGSTELTGITNMTASYHDGEFFGTRTTVPTVAFLEALQAGR